MKKSFLFLGTSLVLLISSCGSGTEEAAALKAQRDRDSIRQDSISNADAESMMQDMIPASGDSAKQDTAATAK